MRSSAASVVYKRQGMRREPSLGGRGGRGPRGGPMMGGMPMRVCAGLRLPFLYIWWLEARLSIAYAIMCTSSHVSVHLVTGGLLEHGLCEYVLRALVWPPFLFVCVGEQKP